MGASGLSKFWIEVRQWWPILFFMGGVAITGTITTSQALAAIQKHELRLDAVERTQATDSMRLRVIEIQTDSTSRTVNRLEDKMDRFIERPR